jgi:hypothetical protein
VTTRTDFGELNGHDVVGARRNREAETIYVTRAGDMPRLGWMRRGARRTRKPGRPGAGMIGTATALLFALGAGLLAVSLAAQYRYLLHERHQHAAALVEALALDVGMLIFSLLALGLARSGKSARVERALIVACAAGSGVMNFAAANDASLRSILAYCMPPVFLAVVADRVISVVRRHYLGDEEHSAWSGLGRAALYGLRFTVAAPSTLGGARRALLVATPLPAIESGHQDQDDEPDDEPSHSAEVECVACHKRFAPVDDYGRVPIHFTESGAFCAGGTLPQSANACPRCHSFYPAAVEACPECGAVKAPRPASTPREGTKTAAFLRVVEERQGPLAGISLDAVGAFSAKYAPDVDLDPGSARRELRKAILAAQAAEESSGSDAR